VYTDAETAALYDVLNTWAPCDDFYLDLVRRAASVLDVGCGTGQILRRARETGHAGRLCGVDPDPAMLGVAAQRADVEWLRATAAAMTFDREFELAIMSGHAFQVLVSDDETRASLRAVHAALVDGGRFAFETRNPSAKAWERWHGMELEAVDAAGRELLVRYDVESVDGELVTFTETTCTRDGTILRVDRSTLRFLDADGLDRLLADAGFVVDERYGGWARQPFAESSDEIVTIAARR
jgi:SAM-dependent methyltransferase